MESVEVFFFSLGWDVSGGETFLGIGGRFIRLRRVLIGLGGLATGGRGAASGSMGGWAIEASSGIPSLTSPSVPGIAPSVDGAPAVSFLT